MPTDDRMRSGRNARVALAVAAVVLAGIVIALAVRWSDGGAAPRLSAEQTLAPRATLRSPGGQAVARMDADGNLVITVGGTQVWASGTAGYPDARLTLLSDGNLVIRSAAGAVLWSSGSTGAPDGSVALRDDGDLVVSAGSRTVWSSQGGLVGATLAAGRTLAPGHGLVSPDGTVSATMLADGDFVVASHGAQVWSTGTAGNPGARLTMADDGNLEVTAASGATLWSSGSSGSSSPRLVLENGGNLVVYSNDIPVWERTGGLTGQPAHSLYWGAYIDTPAGSAPWSTAALHAFEDDAGKNVSIVHWGEPWYDNGAGEPFWPANFDAVRSAGAIPMIDWGSWDLSASQTPDQPAFSLAAVAGGTYDAYITAWAEAAKAWGHPFFLRFDWEMNGNWFPWGTGVNGNDSPAEYVAAWRHVHDIFTEVGATNATWVWCPDIIQPGGTPLAAYYPGSAYVDWVAMDGYNQGTVQHGTWKTFDQVFGYTYAALRALAPNKPIMIAETGSEEAGGSKAAWITDALTRQIPDNFRDVKALVWFNWDTQGFDWDIESSPSAQAAFKAGIAAPNYLSNQYANLATAPIPAP